MRWILVAFSVFLAGGTCARKTSTPPEGSIALRIGSHQLSVEVAATSTQREQGLMFRRKMPADQGMLFVFPAEQPLSFWMKNTYLPLSIAFIDANHEIINIEDMAPLDEQSRTLSLGPALYALEVNQGWFDEHGIKAGDDVRFDLPDELNVE